MIVTSNPPTDDEAARSRINAHKAAGPNGIPGCVLRAGGPDRLTQPVPSPCCCSDLLQIHHHRAGTKTLHSSVSPRLSPGGTHPHHLQVPTAAGCGTTQTHLPTARTGVQRLQSSTALHSVLTFLDNDITYVRMLYSTLTESVAKLTDPGTTAPPSSSSTPVSPKAAYLSPFLSSLFTHDCRTADMNTAAILSSSSQMTPVEKTLFYLYIPFEIYVSIPYLFTSYLHLVTHTHTQSKLI